MNSKANILYRKLINNEIPPDTLGLLRKTIQSVQTENYSMAKKFNGDLNLTSWEKNKEWLQMLKRILQFRESQLK